MAIGGTIDWNQCKELLFMFKKETDQKYRNMMWHFSQGGKCERCEYWDKTYVMERAMVETDHAVPVVPEITDEEMLSAVSSMEVDGTD